MGISLTGRSNYARNNKTIKVHERWTQALSPEAWGGLRKSGAFQTHGKGMEHRQCRFERKMQYHPQAPSSGYLRKYREVRLPKFGRLLFPASGGVHLFKTAHWCSSRECLDPTPTEEAGLSSVNIYGKGLITGSQQM